MKIRIILSNSGGELDRLRFDTGDDWTKQEVSQIIHDELDAWVLAPGDTITIKEVGYAS